MSCRPRMLAISHALLALFSLGDATCVGADVDRPAHVDRLPTTIDAKCRERFLTEAALAWEKQRERLRGVELELTFFDHRTGDDQEQCSKTGACTSCRMYEPVTTTYCIMNDGVTRRLDRDDVIDVMNNRYSFKVLRSANGCSLADFELWQHGHPQPLVGWIDVAEMNLSMGTNLWWLPIQKVMADDDFKMTGAGCGVNDAGDEVVRVVYRYADKASSDYLFQPDGVYWAELVPARFWVVARSGVTSSMTKHYDTSVPFCVHVTTSYQEWNGVPLPKEVRREVVDLQNNVVARLQENRFGTPKACSRPIEEFFLPFYGLSDDPVPSTPATRLP